MIEDFEQCYRAVDSRDRRFDGRFVVAVTSTGIYCRPSCPAQTPKRSNVRFFALPAAAQAAGFRACKRCRPDTTPGSPDWDVRADLTGRALRLIADGAVDTDGVAGLARRLAVSERHLHRQLVAEVGAGPLALARTRRAQTARLLVESTGMQLTDVAYSAGYGSIRQFNEAFREAFGLAPSAIRRNTGPTLNGTGAITLRLPARPPYYSAGVLSWLGTRAVPGVEELDGMTYRRAIALPRSVATVELTPDSDHVQLKLVADDLRDLTALVSRCRRLFDLDADPHVIDGHLADDPVLAPLVVRRPGVRIPGAVDGFELAVRAVLGQQVTVAGARTLAGRLAAAYGKPLGQPAGTVTHLFPTADQLAGTTPADLAGIGLTGARAATLHALATAVADGTIALDPGADRDETQGQLLALPGVGPWTVGYVAMRALGDPDAFPAADLGLRRASAALGGPEQTRDLAERAAAWRPWRSYAAMHLWTHLTAIETEEKI